VIVFMIIGIIFISVIGTLFHFLYEFSGKNKLVGLFAAVNESTWEHIKMALSATFLWSFIDGYVYGSYDNYFFAKVVSVLSLIIVIPLLFYGFKWLLGKSILIIDISIFYIAIIFSQFFFIKLLVSFRVVYFLQYLSLIILFIIFGFYMVLTFMPFKNVIFKDPITKKYGIKRRFHY